jgi:uncharacterized protein (DUF3820 family)
LTDAAGYLNPASEKVTKLLMLALDAGASDGEAENAAVAAVRIMRRSGMKLSDIASPATSSRSAKSEYEKWWEKTVMPFGKHKGKTIGQIARTEPDYLVWCMKNLDVDGTLMDAIKSACQAVGVKTA